MAQTVMVATLGGQPQVVTFALDALLARGIGVDEVVVVHPAGERYRRSLRRLAEAFPGDRYQGRVCRLRSVVLKQQERLLDDICSTADAEVVWQVIHGLVRELKEAGVRLHLVLTGGRRLMALMAISAALLHLEHGDRVWHLFTPDAVQNRVRDGAVLHVRPEDGVELIEVPLAPLGAYFPGIRPLLAASPAQIWAWQTQILDTQDRERCRQVWEQLTPQQQEVLRQLATGQTRRQVAERLSLSVKTVDSHKTTILGLCRQVWGLDESSYVDSRFLERKFGPYLAGLRSG
jgi:CRISPR-associated protein Csx14